MPPDYTFTHTTASPRVKRQGGGKPNGGPSGGGQRPSGGGGGQKPDGGQRPDGGGPKPDGGGGGPNSGSTRFPNSSYSYTRPPPQAPNSTQLKSSVLMLSVYYEDLKYTLITEEPSITLETLIGI